MYIGLISDTHGTFDDPFREFLSPVDEVWHAGDFGGGFRTAAEIAAFKPLLGSSATATTGGSSTIIRPTGSGSARDSGS